MKTSITFILLFTIVSCNNSGLRQKGKSSIPIEGTSIGVEIETLDTMKDINHYYYLANENPKKIGEMILDNNVPPSDNYVTFRVMDSLMAKTIEDRKFYFNVFIKILDKADGALAEGVGLPAMNYTENHTVEFLSLSSNISNKQFDSWASYVGSEILLSSQNDPIKEGEKFIGKLRNNCLELGDKEKSQLESFNKIIIKSIKENHE